MKISLLGLLEHEEACILWYLCIYEQFKLHALLNWVLYGFWFRAILNACANNIHPDQTSVGGLIWVYIICHEDDI